MQNCRSQRGFTIIELMVVIALMFVMASLGIPALMNLVHRTRMEGAAREATIFVQRARMEAVKANTRTVVTFDLGNPNGLTAFTDFAEDNVFNPDAAVTEAKSTDYVVARYFAPSQVALRGPDGDGADAIDGLTDVAGDPVVVLRPDGSVVDAGEFAIGDERGNFLRITISGTAKTSLAKWDRDNAEWVDTDKGGTWTWY